MEERGEHSPISCRQGERQERKLQYFPKSSGLSLTNWIATTTHTATRGICTCGRRSDVADVTHSCKPLHLQFVQMSDGRPSGSGRSSWSLLYNYDSGWRQKYEPVWDLNVQI